MVKLPAILLTVSIIGLLSSQHSKFPLFYNNPISTLLVPSFVMIIILIITRVKENKPKIRVANPIPSHQYEEQGRQYTESKLKELIESPEYKRLAEEKKLPTPIRLNFTGSNVR
ncbi:unnamed protein product [Blepharisma stoltei]|uniref:Uncharacterized protein n=1 Tax=Blepharisma stoltei TaxID=1481888 RepID=A0AAU9JND0_9CILI|nr:unnamed protein product [Blepharisma stoltei]